MKFVIGLIAGIILAGIVVGAYFAGQKFSRNTDNTNATSTSSPSSEASSIPTTSKTVSAGGLLSFNSYSITFPTDWIDSKETGGTTGSEIETLTLTRGDYKIKIYQAATGGAACLYPGDPAIEGPSSNFTTFVEISSKSGLMLRRSGDKTQSGFTVCEKTQNTWQQPTTFGHIGYINPANPDPNILLEMDVIISSLVKN